VIQGFSGGVKYRQNETNEFFALSDIEDITIKLSANLPGSEVKDAGNEQKVLNEQSITLEDTASRAGERESAAIAAQPQIQSQAAVEAAKEVEVASDVDAVRAFAERPIVFVGDSLMFEAVQAIKTFYEYAYITWYNEIRNDSDYGLHTSQLVTKVWDIISKNPRKVFIIGGTNDLWGSISPEHAAWNIGYMVDVIKQNIPDCQIIIHSIPPFGRQAYQRNSILSSIDEVDRFNSIISAYAVQKQVEFVDINKLYKDEEGYMNPVFTSDGIHIILAYYRKWIDEYLNKGIL
jgi:hypothetical protein